MYSLQIENLHKKYNDFEAIRGINLSINKGEIYGLLGPNGAGKSTLIKFICGIEKFTSGKIIFEEKEININKYKRNIGLLPQDIAIYHDFTARENVSFFCSLYGYRGKELKKRVDKSLEFVGLLGIENKKASDEKKIKYGMCNSPQSKTNNNGRANCWHRPSVKKSYIRICKKVKSRGSYNNIYISLHGRNRGVM